MPRYRRLAWMCALLATGVSATCAEVEVLERLAYRPVEDVPAEVAERFELDLYLPENRSGFPTLIWLHGGGLTGGSKHTRVGKGFARNLADAGIAVAMVEYRLNPHVTFPAYVEDTTAALAWVHAHIGEHGGNATRIFLGGHSAGAYLVLMATLDATYFANAGLADDVIAGLIPISGQTSTHFTVRNERGLGERLVVDDAAPLYHVRELPYPVLLISAEKDMALRNEENELLAAALREAGTGNVVHRVWPERDHGTVYSRMAEHPDDPVAQLLVEFVKSRTSL